MRAVFKIAAIVGLAAVSAIPVFAEDSGADIYKQKCALCHGDTGKADSPAGQAFKAPSFLDPAVVKISDADRTVIVTKGKNSMPAFKDQLTAAQIKSVLAYVRTLQK